MRPLDAAQNEPILGFSMSAFPISKLWLHPQSSRPPYYYRSKCPQLAQILSLSRSRPRPRIFLLSITITRSTTRTNWLRRQPRSASDGQNPCPIASIRAAQIFAFAKPRFGLFKCLICLFSSHQIRLNPPKSTHRMPFPCLRCGQRAPQTRQLVNRISYIANARIRWPFARTSALN